MCDVRQHHEKGKPSADWGLLLGMANSGAPRIAERYVGRSPGTSGLLLPGYSSRYFGLMVSMCIAIMLLLKGPKSYWWENHSLKTERRFIISACCSEVTCLPRCLLYVRIRSYLLGIIRFALPVPSHDFRDKWSVTIGCHVVLPEVFETVVS